LNGGAARTGGLAWVVISIGEGNSEDSGFRRAYTAQSARAHMHTGTHVRAFGRDTRRTVHIRRLLGNGFGLLMTGQLS